MQHDPCPLCNNAGIKLLFKKQDNPFYRCRKCGFVFSRPAINPNLHNTINDFEPAYLDYFAERPHDKKNHDALLKKLLKHTSLEGEILDIGCGSGKLVRYLRSKGYAAYGLEPSAALFQAYLQNSELFFNDDVFSFRARYPGRRFNTIILTDVIEHIGSPVDLIAAVSTMLLPGGIVFISTPDTGSLFARIAGKRWHYYNKYHLSLFSRRNLDEMMQKSGFERLAHGYLARYHSLNYLIQYGFNFLLHRNVKVPGLPGGLHLRVNLHDTQYTINKNHY